MRVRGGSGAAAGPVPPPAGLRPMQPTAARELPADQASWAFEPKWDGYRALGHVRVGTALLAATAEQGLEGVVAKRLASTYQPGRRTRHWLKVKHYQRETFLVGGFVPDPGGQVRSRLAPLATGQSPFAEPAAALLGGRWSRPGPDDPAPVFVRPELAVEVTFLGWEGGRLRHPAYSGLAADGR